MKTAEERITELEQRITHLESIINKQQAETNITLEKATPEKATLVQTLPPEITKQGVKAAKKPIWQ